MGPGIDEIEHLVTVSIMNIEWNYNYYQLWSDNEWLLLELIDDNFSMKEGEEDNTESYL